MLYQHNKKKEHIIQHTFQNDPKENDTAQKRWVLLEKLPTILTPRFLFLFFLYAMAFTLFLIGLKLFLLEQRANAHQKTAAEKNCSVLYTGESSAQIQQNVAKNIIRLHVIANSDSVADQRLKLTVRDQILSSLQQNLSGAASIDEAKQILSARQTDICNTAKSVLTAHRNDAPVRVSLQTRYFPVKQYGDLTFPAGTYQALCVEIGKAEGRNWWCVLFPSLCFVDETTATVPDTSKEKLQERLSADEYNALLAASRKAPESPCPAATDHSRPEFRIGLLDWLTR